jgi:hypothetical protein
MTHQLLEYGQSFLRLFLFDPHSPAEFWVKLLVSGLAGGVVLNILAGILRLGNPNLASGIVLFVGFSALMLVVMGLLQHYLGHLLREQGLWIAGMVWAFAANLVVIAPLLKMTWPGGYGSAVFTWAMSWAGAMLAAVLIGASFSLAGTGRSVVKADHQRQAETRELLRQGP